MTIAERIDEARESGKIKSVSVEHWSPNKEGDTIAGYLRGYEESEAKDGKGSYLRAILETDTGLVSCIPGKQLEPLIRSSDTKDRLVIFTYKGQIKLSGGRNLNSWTLEVVTG